MEILSFASDTSKSPYSPIIHAATFKYKTDSLKEHFSKDLFWYIKKIEISFVGKLKKATIRLFYKQMRLIETNGKLLIFLIIVFYI